MLAIELLVEEILRLQNLTMFLQGQLREARNMSDAQGPNMSRAWLDEMGAKLDTIVGQERQMNAQELIARECRVADELLIVVMEDEPVHTDSHPFCSDPTCECRYDTLLLQEYVYGPMERGELTKAEAARLRWGKQV